MSVDLSQKVGLQVVLNDDNKLEFGEGIELDGMSARSFSDLVVVAADESLNLDEQPAYFMYRNVHKVGDEEKITSNNQRFDLTVIPSAKLGEEFIKTSGHYHPLRVGTSVEYPELYYVVSGQATYLMQKHEADGTISDVILARVPAGTAILMPPFYGHVTINETDETLVMANWVAADFSSVYGDYEEKRGAAYYLVAQNGVNIVPNKRYSKVAEMREMQSWPEALQELKDRPIYDYLKNVEQIELLAKPENYMSQMEITKLFRPV